MPCADSKNILDENTLSTVLQSVQKPARYIGREWNSVQKDLSSVELRLALAFPDLYDLGLGNTGLHILYGILNALPWCWAERVYAPAPDMRNALRQHALALFTLESKTPLGAMDGIGFSLQSELTYTTVLGMLELAGIPIRAEERNDGHPLVFAGGPCVLNPEPLSMFMDFFVLGDGEEVVLEVAEAMRNSGQSRNEKLQRLAGIEGVYVPSLHPVEIQPDGRVFAAKSPVISRRTADSIERTPYPVGFIVPFIQQVHDRAAIEVMRGCTRSCRFCHAGMTGRPVRERSPENVARLLDGARDNTGYEEYSLLSLSTCDHSRIAPMLEYTAQWGRRHDASVSLPSLRLDSVSVAMADRITQVRRSGLTFAPEAATERMRRIINKPLDEEMLMSVCEDAFRLGWDHVKLYFMIGLPDESDEDVQAIATLCKRVLGRGKSVKGRAQVHTGISTFVPKPHTPLQWAAQIEFDEILRRQRLIRDTLGKSPAIRFGKHDPESSFIEGLLARAGREAGPLLETAVRKGAWLDTDSESLNMTAWYEAIAEVGYDVAKALGGREIGERLPWDHIQAGVTPAWLRDEWEKAMSGEYTEDCRTGKCHQCGAREKTPEACTEMQQLSRNASAELRSDSEREPLPEAVEPQAKQRLRLKIGRLGPLRFLSHLELMNAWLRALRRVDAPVSHSQGFHAHPKVSFSTASPVGEESICDFMDVVLREKVAPSELTQRLNAALPEGLFVSDAKEVPMDAPSLMSLLAGFTYSVHLPKGLAEMGELKSQIDGLANAEAIPFERDGKRGPVTLDVRPMLKFLALRTGENEELIVDYTTAVIEGKSLRPRDLAVLLGLPFERIRVEKTSTCLAEA